MAILFRFLNGPLMSLLMISFRNSLKSPRRNLLMLSLISCIRSLLRIAKCLPIASGSHIVWPNVSRLQAAATFESSNESSEESSVDYSNEVSKTSSKESSKEFL
jgi:hypothetical protein